MTAPLPGCNVRSQGAIVLAKALENNGSLTQLGLEWNNIGVNEGGIDAICQVLRPSPACTGTRAWGHGAGGAPFPEASHWGRAAGPRGIRYPLCLALVPLWSAPEQPTDPPLPLKALENNTTLTELDLRNNGIVEAGGRAIGNMLRRNRGLKLLDIRWNNIGPAGGKAIAEGARTARPRTLEPRTPSTSPSRFQAAGT